MAGSAPRKSGVLFFEECIDGYEHIYYIYNSVIIIVTVLHNEGAPMRPISSDDKRQVKEDRVRSVFIDTAKEMILAEGAGAVSVRRIADQAAYSYATLYNHFENLNELLWYARNALMEDIGAYIHDHYPADAKGAAGISALFKTYMEYFITYPNAFKFFFFYDLEEPRAEFVSRAKELNFDRAFGEAFAEFAVNGDYTPTELEAIGKTILYAVHGMLMIYISGKDEMSREELYKTLDEILEHLFMKE
jgi:AcrR family transcriptional regulator